ncbi:PTS sugar transporter subunit IIA [Candidatus Fermentibacteria bacterium]|nr:PTS sugar transporter subunit IIA [Candidatus Fermentibacteria bacterium]
MRIADYLPIGAIMPNLPADSKLEALQLMVRAMDKLMYLSDVGVAERDILSREAKMTTGIGHGIAVPHARSEAAKGLQAVLARHAAGLDWAALDGRPVHFIVMVLSHPDSPGPHLQFLAAIARLLNDPPVQHALMQAETARQIHQIVCPPKRKGLFRP